MNVYYKAQGSDASACSFGGNATVVSAKAASGTCSSLIASASSAATAGATGSSGSGSGAASSTTKKSEGVGMVGASLSMGKWIGIYVLVAVFSGAGMIWL